MRLIGFIVALFALLVPLKATAGTVDCSGAADNLACWNLDYADESASNQALLASINTVMTSTNTLIADAMGYKDDLSFTQRQRLWPKLREIAVSGSIVMPDTVSTQPDPLCPNVDYNKLLMPDFPEGMDSYAAWVSHALWLEANNKVPWSLAGLTLTDLRFLFDKVWINYGAVKSGFSIYDCTYPTYSETNCESGYRLVVHHDPQPLYELTDAEIDLENYGGTRRDAVNWLIGTWGNNWSHNAECGTAYTVPQGLARTPTGTGGCQYASNIAVAMARAMNIPAYWQVGWLQGGGHRSAIFPSSDTDVFMAHGDDFYTAGLASTPDENVSISWTWAQANLTQSDSGNEATNENVRSMKTIAMPSSFYTSVYCSAGEQWFEDWFDNAGIFTGAESYWRSVIYKRLQDLTGGDGTPGGC